ncbi:RPL40, partial [Symbiodinium sp. KB8]
AFAAWRPSACRSLRVEACLAKLSSAPLRPELDLEVSSRRPRQFGLLAPAQLEEAMQTSSTPPGVNQTAGALSTSLGRLGGVSFFMSSCTVIVVMRVLSVVPLLVTVRGKSRRLARCSRRAAVIIVLFSVVLLSASLRATPCAQVPDGTTLALSVVEALLRGIIWSGSALLSTQTDMEFCSLPFLGSATGVAYAHSGPLVRFCRARRHPGRLLVPRLWGAAFCGGCRPSKAGVPT